MPIYEYECRRCGHEFEIIQKFSEKSLRKCPECAKQGLHKKVSAAAFHLKGSGWYVTDFRDKGGKKDVKDGKANGDGESKKTETKSDTKPDSKSDTKSTTKSTEKSSSKSDKKVATG